MIGCIVKHVPSPLVFVAAQFSFDQVLVMLTSTHQMIQLCQEKLVIAGYNGLRNETQSFLLGLVSYIRTSMISALRSSR